jgi:hypothetical protein
MKAVRLGRYGGPEKNERRRLVPTKTFVGKETPAVGSVRIELERGNWH